MIHPKPSAAPVNFRSARHGDGAALWQLVKSAGTLELNSAYFYLLFASDFGDTCLVAEADDKIVGTVIGYRPPANPASAFVWQIGVAPDMQGQGLGKELLRHWISLPGNAGAQWVTATVTEDNVASARLFRAFARDNGAACEDVPHFTAELFPHEHPAERLFRIGPLDREGNTEHSTLRTERPIAEPS